jgi:glycosyltransferase involved in cell wall biosynthesis
VTRPGAARKIAVLLQSLEGGGSQRRIVELVNGFVALGREVDLILADPRGELRDRLSDRVRTVALDRSSLSHSLSDYLNRERPDALLAGAAAVHAIAVDAIRGEPRIPLILRASSHPFRAFPWTLPRQRLIEPFRRRARIRHYAAADLIIAVAEDVAVAIRRGLPSARVAVIPNPVVTTDFLHGAEATIAWPWPDAGHTPLILGIGRFAVAKDFPTLLRAFALLRQKRPGRLVILGDGSVRERQALARLVRKLGIGADVALPGMTDHVAAWLKRADLFVSSSLWEGSAGALIEALAMGCPVVATQCVGSARELLQDGRLGGLMPPRNPAAMAEAMARQLDEPPDRAKLVAAAEPFRADERAADYLSAIDTCVREFKS